MDSIQPSLLSDTMDFFCIVWESISTMVFIGLTQHTFEMVFIGLFILMLIWGIQNTFKKNKR